MDFNKLDDIKKNGFLGFRSIRDLIIDSSQIPTIKGVYFILYVDKKSPSYLQVGTGGHFKGRNPNVSIEKLKSNWVENTLVIYIGKAGSDSSRATLNSRLRQYLSFGQGKNIGHWGGRLIWQLASSDKLVVCWKPLLTDDPRTMEANLIRDFVIKFGKRPFANLTD